MPVDSVTIDLRVGGAFALTTVGPHGSRRLRFTYLEIAEPRRLVLSEPETGIITNIDLVPQGVQTFLTIHQRRVPPQLTGEAARRGLAGILAKLDELVAGLSAHQAQKGDPVSPQKTIVETYMEGFRRGDHGAILDCLTDDVTWLIAGYTTKQGKEAFEGEIVNENFEGRPALAVNRVVEEGNTVVAIGEGHATHRTQGEFRFAFSDVFTFRERLIERVESYITPLGQPSP